MRIKHLEKFSVIDYPDKFACIVFLFGCNFRCGFCHNPELVLRDSLDNISEKQVFDFLDKRKNRLEGVCITGGEPLLSLDLDFLKKIKEKGFLIKIDTNGSYPERLREIIDLGLVDFVAMDLKCDKESYSFLCGVDVDLNKIEESVKLIVESGIDYEFRTTVIEEMHTKENMKKMGEWVFGLIGKKAWKLSLQGFRNSGKVLDKSFEDKKNTEEIYLEELKEIMKNYFEEVEVRV
ncbi:MAG: anaerobic ribonucleoside-triphosphate reductase activating protein [Candidatus Pacearchaeota archaeon]|nr:anaerobic ribonucleoside-triphosphate reductase activating protein [Candidatus Pacearchaeota archaeon]